MLITFDFLSVLSEWQLLLKGVALTIALTLISALLGVTIGIAGAWSRIYGGRGLKIIVGFYVELIRNTPFIVQLFFIFFGLPGVGIRLSPEVSSIIAMVINLGAYSTKLLERALKPRQRGKLKRL